MPEKSLAKILIILFFTGAPFVTTAQEKDTFDIARSSVYFPHRFQPREFRMELAMSQVKLPFDWLETAVQAPLFQFHVNYGLPKGFVLDSRFSSLFVSN